MAFQDFDLVKWSVKPGVWEVKACRPQERKYSIQFGTDFAMREWANEDELELVERPKTYGPAGFTPSTPLTGE
jgi:hypothetical protein